ncbi:hypothetical protein K7X08_035265 [Anisodus acutangulus]|uniref:Purple acid phosphatase n=1 Tax=Anisodus acutangulus TaxID=402998 RepID=A0A9Q1R1N8_9SOLA|nr:hypothetical protein K7X08_035265 [Anisodus acutangulus]
MQRWSPSLQDQPTYLIGESLVLHESSRTTNLPEWETQDPFYYQWKDFAVDVMGTLVALLFIMLTLGKPVDAIKQGQNKEWVVLEYSVSNPSADDWIGVFSPGNFSASSCFPENPRTFPPFLCTAPIKYQYANYSSPHYKDTGKGSLKLQLINQRSDFSFALFSGGLFSICSQLSHPCQFNAGLCICLAITTMYFTSKISNFPPKLVAVSKIVAFANPNASIPTFSTRKDMTVTWTSGYGINEGGQQERSPAGTLTFDHSSMCGAPARTVGWRDPGFIHTSFLKELWPNTLYTYKLGHRFLNGTYIWYQMYQFKSSPYPGQKSLQRVVIFGDMGKDEADGSNEYNQFQPGSRNTTNQLINDLKNIDIVFHIGDICYANGYISQWDQFTSQIEPIASTVPYMLASGNHERDWPGTGHFMGIWIQVENVEF